MANHIPSVLPTSRKYFYFRTVSSLAADDGDVSDGSTTEDATSMIVPVSAFRGVQPTDDNHVTLYFEPVIRVNDVGADAFKNCDTVALRHDTANEAKEVMKSILDSAISERSGMIVVADDVDGVYLPFVSSVGAITINPVYA
tara:strand:+ start:810 stop:1235 length:426 start_codon:yes stop_codon:yes gene_type:complete